MRTATASLAGAMDGARPSVAVVTGAGRGFGREIARGLAARGYSVLAGDIDGEAAERTAAEIGDGSWSRQMDVRDPEAHRSAAEAAAGRGRLDVWVNNAGVMRTAMLRGLGRRRRAREQAA